MLQNAPLLRSALNKVKQSADAPDAPPPAGQPEQPKTSVLSRIKKPQRENQPARANPFVMKQVSGREDRR